MNDDEFYDIFGFVKASRYRILTLQSIGEDLKTPTQVARELNVQTSHISSTLKSLKNKGIVVCVNENVRKGRLYACSDLGLKILEELND